MWKNKTFYNGLSVLPYDGGSYTQAPFEDIEADTFDEMNAQLKEVDVSQIIEIVDNTNLTGELACAGGSCELT